MTTRAMPDNPMSEEALAARRRRAVRNALLLALVALAFYAGFILLGALRA